MDTESFNNVDKKKMMNQRFLDLLDEIRGVARTRPRLCDKSIGHAHESSDSADTIDYHTAAVNIHHEWHSQRHRIRLEATSPSFLPSPPLHLLFVLLPPF